MKHLYILPFLLCLTFLFAEAQSTYTISANTSYTKAAYPSYCSGCTFNIAPGKTLTLDNAGATCANCVFKGGDVSITSNYVCQTCSFSSDSIKMTNATLTLQSATTSFSGVFLTASGTGSVTANSPVTLSNSRFTFNNNTFFLNNGGVLTLSSSAMDFYNSAYFLANAGPVNMEKNSALVAGNGVTTSTAYIKINGPQLNIYDNSSIGIAGTNNYYFNWSSYYSVSNNKNYSTAINTSNCGLAGENKCTAATVFGPVSINATGLQTYNLLPVVLEDFNAAVTNQETVEISWKTEQELNADFFTVERSPDATNWEAIGTVKAKGNSVVVTDYAFTDRSPLTGNNYYRLQMVDLDNSAALSEITHASNNAAEGQVSVFPNPVTNGSFNLQVANTDPVLIRMFTMEGKLLYVNSLQGSLQYSLQMPASAARNSNIALQVIGKSKSQTIIVLVK